MNIFVKHFPYTCSLILICNVCQSNLSYKRHFNSLPIDKILDLSKFKAFADDKINVTQKFIFLLERVGNIEGKGENAGNQQSLLPRSR